MESSFELYGKNESNWEWLYSLDAYFSLHEVMFSQFPKDWCSYLWLYKISF